jgi:hypothetical protein
MQTQSYFQIGGHTTLPAFLVILFESQVEAIEEAWGMVIEEVIKGLAISIGFTSLKEVYKNQIGIAVDFWNNGDENVGIDSEHISITILAQDRKEPAIKELCSLIAQNMQTKLLVNDFRVNYAFEPILEPEDDIEIAYFDISELV